MTYIPGIGFQGVHPVAAIYPTIRRVAPITRIDFAGAVDAQLSSTGALLSQALSTSDVRLDKVAALQQSIAAGTYDISAADVAGKLFDAILA